MLKTKHFFPFVRMIRALDIKEPLKEIVAKTKDAKSKKALEKLDQEEGIDYLFLFIERLPNAEEEVMHFLSVYLEKSTEEVGEMDLVEIFDVLKGIVEDEKFGAFFKLAVK